MCRHGSTRGRAGRDAATGEGGGARPRGPPRDVPQHAHHPGGRGARAHPLQAGEDPRIVLHRARERGLRRGRRDGDGPERRRHAAAARHGRPHHPRHRAVAHLRPVHGPRGRPHPRTRRQRPHGRLPARAPHDGEPPARDASGRRRDGPGVQDPRRAARRRRLVRRGRGGPGRRPRGDEPRRRPPPPGRLRDRQQPVGLLDARRTSSTPSTISPIARPPTASTASSSTAPTSSPSTARRSTRSRRHARAAARR